MICTEPEGGFQFQYSSLDVSRFLCSVTAMIVRLQNHYITNYDALLHIFSIRQGVQCWGKDDKPLGAYHTGRKYQHKLSSINY